MTSHWHHSFSFPGTSDTCKPWNRFSKPAFTLRKRQGHGWISNDLAYSHDWDTVPGPRGSLLTQVEPTMHAAFLLWASPHRTFLPGFAWPLRVPAGRPAREVRNQKSTQVDKCGQHLDHVQHLNMKIWKINVKPLTVAIQLRCGTDKYDSCDCIKVCCSAVACCSHFCL